MGLSKTQPHKWIFPESCDVFADVLKNGRDHESIFSMDGKIIYCNISHI